MIVRVLVVMLVARMVCAGNTNAVWRIDRVNMAAVPESIRRYIESDVAGFERNMNAQLEKGLTEEEAWSKLIYRLYDNLQKREADKIRKKFLENIDNLPEMQKREVLRKPELYENARRRLNAGLEMTDRELWLLNVKREKEGTLRRALGTKKYYLYQEILNANKGIKIRRIVFRIQSMRVWLSNYCPPNQMPKQNLGYENYQYSLNARLEIAEAELAKLVQYINYYAAKVAEREYYRQSLQELMNRLDDIEAGLRNESWRQ